MTKRLSLIFILFIVVCGGSFAQAYEPPSYLLFHDTNRLDSLELQANDNNLFEIIILMYNIAFHKNDDIREKAENFLDKNFKKDERPMVLMYRSLLELLKIRDRGLSGNGIRRFGGFLGITKDPYEEARESYANVRLAIQMDSSSVQLRLLGLSAAVESAETFHDFLKDAYDDLLWLKARTSQLDSAETFFYALSWAKYSYKSTKIKDHQYEAMDKTDWTISKKRDYEQAYLKGRKNRLINGLAWIVFAEQFAVIEDYRNEARVWQFKIESLQTK